MKNKIRYVNTRKLYINTNMHLYVAPVGVWDGEIGLNLR